MGSTVLIDCDSFVYAAGCAVEHRTYKVSIGENEHIFNTETEMKKWLYENKIPAGDFTVKKVIEYEPLSHAQYLLRTSVDFIIERFCDSKVRIFLTSLDKSNFRYKVAETQPYKGNRFACKVCTKTCKSLFSESKETLVECTNSKCPSFGITNDYVSQRPRYFEDLRDYLELNYTVDIIHDMEADDAISIYCNKNKDKEDITVVTIDKDLHQIEGVKFFNPKTQEFEAVDRENNTIWLSEDRRKLYGLGEKFLYAQMLQGDNADNIQGIKGYGPVKIFNMLNDLSVPLCHDKVKKIYNNDRHFKENMLLLSLLKTGDEDLCL